MQKESQGPLIQEALRKAMEEMVGTAPEKKSGGGSLLTEDHDFIKKFKMKPGELIKRVSEVIVGQEDAIRVLATKMCGHYHRIKKQLNDGIDPMQEVLGVKSNILLIGETGVGKSAIVKTLAHLLGVPFHRVDATKFTEAGYVGGDVEDMVKELVNKTKDEDGNPNIGLAQYGIIFIDEVDKIASSGRSNGPDVSRTGVQQALLTLIEDAEVPLLKNLGPAQQLKLMKMMHEGKEFPPDSINTKNILFVFSGAFPGLKDIISKRINKGKRPLGFQAGSEKGTVLEIEDHVVLKEVATEDLVEYGLIAELVGRIPVREALQRLTSNDLFLILSKPGCQIVANFKTVVGAYGTQVEFEDEALRYLAEKATGQNTGARGLASVFEKVMSTYECQLAEREIPKLKFTKELVDGSIDPVEFLEELERLTAQKMNEIKAQSEQLEQRKCGVEGYAEQIHEEYGVKLVFTEGAKAMANALALKAQTTPRQVCKRIFTGLENAFVQLSSIGHSEITVTEEAFSQPVKFLEKQYK